MADAFLVLGQSAPAAGTLTDLYTAATPTIISSLVVCNRSATPTSFRVSVAPGGAADAVAQYLWYDVLLGGNDTFVATVGLSLAVGDKLRVQAALATVTFSAFGVQP